MVMPALKPPPGKSKNEIETSHAKYLYALSFRSSRTKGIFEKVKSRSKIDFLGTAYSFPPFAP